MRPFLHISRAKPIGNPNTWVIGFYHYSLSRGHSIITSDDPIRGIERFKVDPKTVGICSGILDPLKHMIFEQDCIGHRLNHVEICNGSFCTNGDRDLYLESKTLTVIGNYHDGVIQVENLSPLRTFLTDRQKNDIHFNENPEMEDEEVIRRLTGTWEEIR